MKFAKYDPTNGRILFVGEVPDSMIELQSGPLYEGEANQLTQYIVDGELHDRPANPTVVTGSVLTNVPVPATLKVDGVVYQTNEATIELDFPNPGTYKIVVESWPHLNGEYEITI